MSQLDWFRPPRSVESTAERRRGVRYPGGPSLRGQLMSHDSAASSPVRVHTISTDGVSIAVDHSPKIDADASLHLENAGRGFRCTLGVRFAYVASYRGDLVAGGWFDRPLSKEELERLTPTLSPWLEVEPHEDILIGRFTCPDLSESQAVTGIGEQLFGLVEELGQRNFVLNLEAVQRANCAFLSQLIEFRRRVIRSGGQLAISNLDPLVRHIFEATMLTRVFCIHPTEAEAVRSFAPTMIRV